MIKKIVKRDGRIANFDLAKIEQAIYKALLACDMDDIVLAKRLSLRVYEVLEERNYDKPHVEEIQDIVEEVLMQQQLPKVAKKYIIYRDNRTKVREMDSELMNIYKGITFQAAKDNDIKRENANINTDTAMGVMLKYGSEGSKEFNKKFLLKPRYGNAHIEGDIHIHDLDFYNLTLTCCQIDLTKLFTGGFSTGHGYLREPNDISSYAALACIAIQSNQNDQHGGQSVPAFDYDMAPGVKKTYKKRYLANLIKIMSVLKPEVEEETVKNIVTKIEKEFNLVPTIDKDDFEKVLRQVLSSFCTPEEVEKIEKFVKKEAWKETDRATYQAMESLIHNLNTMHSRAGAQVPFSSLNYGTDTSSEGRMVIRNLLLATEAGLGNGETPIFPIQIFKVKEGVSYNPEDPNYDLFRLACKVSSKRLFPNFSFLDAPFNLQYYRPGNYHTEVTYMGCRTRVIGNVDKDNEIVTGRGNLSFTSINLPRLGIKAQGDITKFYELLDEQLDIVVEQLLDRFEIQCKKKVYNFPFLMGQKVWLGSDKLSYDDEVREVIKHGTLSIGFIGLAETLVALIGKHHGESSEAQQLGLEIVNHMRKRIDAEMEKHQLNFSLLATPAEGLAGRFVKMDRKLFGKIKGVTDHEYYTNSFHVPVYHKVSIMDKIKIEGKYHPLTNAGHITYVELDGDPAKNVDAFEQIIRTMKENNIGYGSINHPLDRDPVCGYSGIINDECPRCGRHEDEGRNFERIRRITGYLVGTLDRFNDAKRAEVKERVKHGRI